MKHFETLAQLHQENGWSAPRIPMFSIVEFEQSAALDEYITINAFVIRYKEESNGSQAMLAFHTPGESLLLGKPGSPLGCKLIFIHEEFIIGHVISTYIHRLGLFETPDADKFLRLSSGDVETFCAFHNVIDFEYSNFLDEFSREILLGHVTAMLLYAYRFTNVRRDAETMHMPQ